jgi:hypothetical protein
MQFGQLGTSNGPSVGANSMPRATGGTIPRGPPSTACGTPLEVRAATPGIEDVILNSRKFTKRHCPGNFPILYVGIRSRRALAQSARFTESGDRHNRASERWFPGSHAAIAQDDRTMLCLGDQGRCGGDSGSVLSGPTGRPARPQNRIGPSGHGIDSPNLRPTELPPRGLVFTDQLGSVPAHRHFDRQILPL